MFEHTHLNDDKLSSAVHFARFRLPNAGGCCVHASSETCNNSPNHHAGDLKAASLDDSSDGNNSRTKYNLARAPEDITRPDGAHGADKAADVVDRGHYTLHIRRRVAESMKEVLRNDDIAKDTLVVTVEAECPLALTSRRYHHGLHTSRQY